MTEPKTKALDTASLTPHDQRMVREPRSEWTLTARPPIALTDMTSGLVPTRDRINDGLAEVKDMWGTLAKAPFSVFSASRGDTQETIVVGPSLTAHDVNGLLYFAAPYKGFGFDTDDIIGDWTALYTESYHANRKKAHAMMPGWGQFEESRERVLGVLQRNYQSGDFRLQNRSDVVVPVLRWTRDAEGNSRIVLEPLDEDLQVAIASALPDQVKDQGRLDGGMGLMFLAAYSPDQTRWPTNDGYKHSGSSSTQTIGPTQVLAYAYREVAMRQADATRVPDDQDVQQSFLLDGLGRYAETGDIPAIDITGDSVDSFFTPKPANPYITAVSTAPSFGNQDTLVNVGGFVGASVIPQGQFLPAAAVVTPDGIKTPVSVGQISNIEQVLDKPPFLPGVIVSEGILSNNNYYEEEPLTNPSKLINSLEKPPKYGEEITIVSFKTPKNNQIEKKKPFTNGTPKAGSTILPKNYSGALGNLKLGSA